MGRDNGCRRECFACVSFCELEFEYAEDGGYESELNGAEHAEHE